MPTIRLPNNWNPRFYQMPAWKAWERGIRREVLMWHRRAGKDDYELHKTAVAAHERVANYWHCLPLYEQARKAIWEAVNPHSGKRRIDECFPPELRQRTDNTSMTIEFKVGSIWRVVGSDNPDSLVGAPPAGLVFSEWALANPSAWAYLSPIVAENNGWASFITTPRGNNHAAALYNRMKSNPEWFCQRLTVDDTHAISDKVIEDARDSYEALFGKEVAEMLIQQEYYCSFNGAMVGAYYAGLIDRAEQEGRIRDFDIDPAYPVHTAWDLSPRGSRNPIWCFQVIGGVPYIVDFLRPNTDSLEDWVNWLNERGYCGVDFVPHDIMHAEWGTKRTRFELLASMGRKPHRVPSVAVEEGRTAARQTINKAVFHATNCELALDGLRNYRREWDDDTKRFRDQPVKDWADHIADGFRYLALAWRDMPKDAPTKPKPKDLEYRVLPSGVIQGNVGVKEAVEAMVRRKRREA